MGKWYTKGTHISGSTFNPVDVFYGVDSIDYPFQWLTTLSNFRAHALGSARNLSYNPVATASFAFFTLTYFKKYGCSMAQMFLISRDGTTNTIQEGIGMLASNPYKIYLFIKTSSSASNLEKLGYQNNKIIVYELPNDIRCDSSSNGRM